MMTQAQLFTHGMNMKIGILLMQTFEVLLENGAMSERIVGRRLDQPFMSEGIKAFRPRKPAVSDE